MPRPNVPTDAPSLIEVYGDMGGQLEPFRYALKMSGVDMDTLDLPPGLVIIQIGDLVAMTGRTTHQNEQVVDLALALQERNPGRYIQLWGNHDLAVVGGVRKPDWTEEFDEEVNRKLRLLNPLSAVAVRIEGKKPTLLTHAGITRGLWRGMGTPGLIDLVRSLNRHSVEDKLALQRPGYLVTGNVNLSADEQQAEVNFELYAPWLDNIIMPWDQVHGHASPLCWATGRPWPGTPQWIMDLTTLFPFSRTSMTATPDCVFHSVNWELTDRDKPTDVAPFTIRLRPDSQIITE